MQRWIEKVAVVTGASSGIGASIAKQLAEEGLQVIGLTIHPEKIQEIKKELPEKSGKNLIAKKCDVTKDEEIFSSFNWIKEKIGHVHILVNNAGIFTKGTILDSDPKNIRKTIDINLTGLTICTQVAMKQMIEKNIDGQIIQISSVCGHWPVIGDPPIFNIYSPTKFAVNNLTEVLRQELAHINKKIRVTNISPGLVYADLFKSAGLEPDGQMKDKLMLNPEDVAQAVLYVLKTPQHVLVQDLIIRRLLSF